MPSPAKTLAFLGGEATLGEDVDHNPDLLGIIRRGVRVRVAEYLLEKEKLTLAELDKVIMPRRTYAYRKLKFDRFTREQSDRLVRVARVMAGAEEAFGAADRAHIWLRRPTTALGGESPLDLLDTDEGARRVETLLGRIEHGIAA
jgi:putative toxin-antitoxin system antitoxin component (TIGR02293 family)